MSSVKTIKGSLVNLSIADGSLQFQIKPNHAFKVTADDREFILVLELSQMSSEDIIESAIKRIPGEKEENNALIRATVEALERAGTLQKAYLTPVCSLIGIDKRFITTINPLPEVLFTHWMDKKTLLKFTLDDKDRVTSIEPCDDDKK